MKRIIKEIIGIKLVCFLTGYIKLSTLNKFEIKRTRLINNLILNYYKYKVSKLSIKIKRNNKKRIFIVLNTIPLWNSSTSNFLKVIADVCKYYNSIGYKVSIIITNHSHCSYFRNNGLKWSNLMMVDPVIMIDKIYNDLFNMNRITKNDLNIIVLNLNKGNVTLNDYFNNFEVVVNKIGFTKSDLIFHIGGKVKSMVFEEILKFLDSKRIYIQAGVNEVLINTENYDYIFTLNQNLYDNSKFFRTINLNLSVFYWEMTPNIRLSYSERTFLKKIKNKDFKYLFISAKQKIALSIDDEFIDIMNKIEKKYPESEFCLIGDTQKNIENVLKNKLTFDISKINVVEFSESLYSFYKRINSNVETFFIFPRISGGGTGNLTVANAGIPTTIFKGNDAEGSWLPAKYFVETKEEYLNQLDGFVKNQNGEREQFLIDFQNHKKKIEDESKEMCMRLLNYDK